MTRKSLSQFKIMLFAVALALVSISVVAQPHPPQQKGKPNPQERAEQLTQVMTQKLQLNDKQTAAVKDINLRYAAQLAEFRQNNQQHHPAAGKPNPKVKELRQQRSAELKNVLTPEQFAQYQEMEEHFLDQRQQHGAEHGGKAFSAEERANRMTQKLQKELNLTPQQAEKMQQIALKHAQQTEQMRKEQQQNSETMQAKRAQMHQQHLQEVNSILTEEQKKKFETLKQEWRKGEHPHSKE